MLGNPTEYCDLVNINELSVNFDLEVTYFLHIHLLGNPTDFRDLIYILCNCQAHLPLIN